MKKTYALLLLHFFFTGTLIAQQKNYATGCLATQAQVDLAINNVRARLLVGGDLWWDPVSQVNMYEFPKGSGKKLLYAGSLWVGGVDPFLQLEIAAQTYRQPNTNDFWAGPISSSPTTPSYGEITPTRCNEFDRFWSITRNEVESFVQGGAASTVIQDWPGNGDVANGELPLLAPFFDANNNGNYSYQDGDYPLFNLGGNYPPRSGSTALNCNGNLLGDQCIWWVFNDVGNTKTETGSDPIGLEVRAMAYAYNSTDTVLNNTTFYTYQLINRSTETLNQTYIGMWCDAELGYGLDDYVGCDVGKNIGYVFNGDGFDETSDGYGATPPACGIKILRGPLAPALDGIDNDNDQLIDEPGEELGLTNFIFYVGMGNAPNGRPGVTNDYYDYLSGHWLDGISITYGGDGRGSGIGATNIVTGRMFPNNSDYTYINSGNSPWTMASAGMIPDDMRFLESSGPFDFAPGGVYFYSNAVIAATSPNGPTASLNNVLQGSLHIQDLFDQCFTTLTGVEQPTEADFFNIYPSPFHLETMIHISPSSKGRTTYNIYSFDGKLIFSGSSNENQFTIGSQLTEGSYLVELKAGNHSFTKKILKL